MDTLNKKPITISGPLPGQAVDAHLQAFGHLPNTPLCDERGTCIMVNLLTAILDKLEEIRCGLIDVETTIEERTSH